MKLIPLNSRKYPGLSAMVDDEDFERLSRYRWNPYTGPNRSTFYAITSQREAGKRRTIYMHVMCARECPAALVRDHKDGNGLNNQRENIRFVTSGFNSSNGPLRKNNTSGANGISFRASCGDRPWIAYWTEDGERTFSQFRTKAEAIAFRRSKDLSRGCAMAGRINSRTKEIA